MRPPRRCCLGCVHCHDWRQPPLKLQAREVEVNEASLMQTVRVGCCVLPLWALLLLLVVVAFGKGLG